MKLEASRSIKDEGELAQVRPLTRKVNRWIYMSEKKLLFVYFTVIIKDESGCRVTEGGHKVSIEVQLRNNLRRVHLDEGNRVKKPIVNRQLGNRLANIWEALAVQDNGDGSYTFSYCPMQPGFCSLSVKVEGKPINRSPFKWQVNQAQAYYRRYVQEM